MALAWVGVAAADTPQGKLTGGAVFAIGSSLTIATPVIDGGTNFAGLENDKSGTCSGDSGEVVFNAGSDLQVPISCAHFVASSRDGSGPKMRFAFLVGVSWYMFRISDGGPQGPDKVVGLGISRSFTGMQAWVNKGLQGGSDFPLVIPWQPLTLASGGYTITASQT